MGVLTGQCSEYSRDLWSMDEHLGSADPDRLHAHYPGPVPLYSNPTLPVNSAFPLIVAFNQVICVFLAGGSQL